MEVLSQHRLSWIVGQTQHQILLVAKVVMEEDLVDSSEASVVFSNTYLVSKDLNKILLTFQRARQIKSITLHSNVPDGALLLCLKNIINCLLLKKIYRGQVLVADDETSR